MAEIIREGKLPTEKWLSAVCKTCSTYFKFQKKEIQDRGDQREGFYKYMDCPLCKTEVIEPQGGFEDYWDKSKKPWQSRRVGE